MIGTCAACRIARSAPLPSGCGAVTWCASREVPTAASSAATTQPAHAEGESDGATETRGDGETFLSIFSPIKDNESGFQLTNHFIRYSDTGIGLQSFFY